MCVYMYNNKDLEPFFKDLVAEMQEIDYQGELGAQFNIYWKTDLWDQEIWINSNSRVRVNVVQKQLPWAAGSWLCVSKSMPSTLVTWLSHGGSEPGNWQMLQIIHVSNLQAHHCLGKTFEGRCFSWSLKRDRQVPRYICWIPVQSLVFSFLACKQISPPCKFTWSSPTYQFT